MPLERIIDKYKSGKVAVWHLTESLHTLENMLVLTEDDEQQLKVFKLDKRKQEWLCARIMLQQLLGYYPEIKYGDNGKPFLSDKSKHISISHTNHFVAVSISDQPTALDIEICSERVEKAARRFVHDEEWNFITDNDKITYLTLIWSAKETLYKYFDEWGLVFKTQLQIFPFTLKPDGEINSYCRSKRHDQELLLQYEVTQQYALVYHLNANT